jgi:hypothetical protein
MTIADLEKKERAERRLAKIAAAMLDGSLLYLDGAELVVATSRDAELDRDPDILPFSGVASEADRFPASHIRCLWDREAMEKMQPEIDRLEAWAKELAEPHARSLLARFATVKRSPPPLP